MRHPVMKMNAHLVMLASMVALVFAVGTMIGTTTSVSAASAKRTGATTSGAKTTTVFTTTTRIKVTRVDTGPDGQTYDLCNYPLGEYGYQRLCFNYDSDFGYTRYEWDWDSTGQKWISAGSSYVSF